MRIITTRMGDSPTLAEPDDFRSFSVVTPGPPDAGALAQAAGSLGRAAGDAHVFVDTAVLRALPGARPDDEEWALSLEAMLAFANSRGWVDDAGMVRAHVQWT